MDFETWRTITIVSAAVGQGLFVVLYLTFPWWKGFLGRALFFKALALGLLANTVAVARVYALPNEDAIITSLYGLVSVGIWAQFFAFLSVRMQRRAPSLDRPSTDPRPTRDRQAHRQRGRD